MASAPAQHQTVVVVGHGMVGHRFVEALRTRDQDDQWRIVVLGEESDGARLSATLRAVMDLALALR